jgi:hypothetical protein
MEEEVDNKINFLDIIFPNMFNIYRKHTAADIIPNDPCHPLEHKLAAISYLPNCLSTYPIFIGKKENDTIKQILYNNKYGTAILNKVNRTKDVQEHKEGKAKFTYVGRQTTFINKLFKNS